MYNEAKQKKSFGMPQEPGRHAQLPKTNSQQWLFLLCVAQEDSLSQMLTPMWIMCVILEEELTEMPQYISVTCGMRRLIGTTDFVITGAGQGSASKNLFLTIRGVSLPHRHMHLQRCTLTSRLLACKYAALLLHSFLSDSLP